MREKLIADQEYIDENEDERSLEEIWHEEAMAKLLEKIYIEELRIGYE